MTYQYQCCPYRRRFKQALQTSHGVWAVREGIILCLVNEAGQVGWGEIAPLPWFGSETIAQALAFCQQLPEVLTDDVIFSIPDALPCCQFAFESAWEGMRGAAIGKSAPQRRRGAERRRQRAEGRGQRAGGRGQEAEGRRQKAEGRRQEGKQREQNSKLKTQNSKLSSVREACPTDSAARSATQNSKLKTLPPTPHPPPFYSALLPAGNAALQAWKPLWEKGFRTFKWKIGVQAIATELEILHLLAQTLPAAAKLRLDANGGLSMADATQWLQVCDALADAPGLTLEYLEQPLPIAQFQAMQDLSQRHTTPIALDESVATRQQLQTCYENGWRGIFVIKPAIVGSPSRLRQFCQIHAIDAVFSSAFETAIGRQAGLQLAAAFGNPDRAMGYGITHWFDDWHSHCQPQGSPHCLKPLGLPKHCPRSLML